MSEIHTTLVGNIATEVVARTTRSGASVASFRMAVTVRRNDRDKGWVDGHTSWVTVTCWRALADNVSGSLSIGHQVIVVGRLRVRDWATDDGRRGTAVEVEATSVGHDLSRGTSVFRRADRSRAEGPDDEDVMHGIRDELDRTGQPTAPAEAGPEGGYPEAA